MIDGVVIHPLRQIPDERGRVMHMLKATDAHFQGFGEVYFSVVHPGAIKGWHLHREMVINYAVPHGRIKLVIYDPREGSPTQGEVQEIFLSPENYCLVQVPVGVWNGFKGYGATDAIVCNCATQPHEGPAVERLSPFDPSIPYDWDIVHR